eukprot:CAMPEP_0201586406 /NCGR_PEP_ID=MMETSP0190_2-20130828/132541_1 /ASSEMBLY_ACC=CAM_ASM_000263 /TAXON_ID=37353 /ORGANISM="Rosalina sp." /LENGTH=76 /DNA_ID=CAMNT_0048034367 /DNA_START=238 /DNA_END=468 /DNA_ORIENTATION=+
MQKGTNDEHYLGYSEAQPLNTSNRSANSNRSSNNNKDNDDKKSTLSPPSTSHDITVNSQEVEYFESNDDATAEYFD